MKIHLLGLAMLGTCAFAGTDSTNSLAQTTGIGIAIGGQRYEGSYGDNAMPYFRAHAEYHPLEWLGGRIIGGFGNISNGSSEFRTEYFSNIGLQGVLQPKFDLLGNFRPYFATGVSTDFGTAKRFGSRVYDLDYNVYWPVELGLEYLVTEHLSVTGFAENRVHSVEWDKLDGVVSGGNYYEKRDELVRAGFGLTWRFGAPAIIAAPAAAVVATVRETVKEVKAVAVEQVDSDRDGVFDPMDKCADTPHGLKVDAAGCPLDSDKDGIYDEQDKCPSTTAGVKTDSTGCPLDTDKDGVADDQDKCLATPAGVAIDALGCPVDSDKDRIADYLDKCANTPAGVKVDSTGCQEIKIEKGAKLTLQGILFKSGSADIDSSSAPALAQAARAILKAPSAKIEIAGFTDNQGNAKKNQILSGKRAEAVKKYLVKLGVAAKQLISKGYGAAQPVADNKTDEGRSINRRIEFRVK